MLCFKQLMLEWEFFLGTHQFSVAEKGIMRSWKNKKKMQTVSKTVTNNKFVDQKIKTSPYRRSKFSHSHKGSLHNLRDNYVPIIINLFFILFSFIWNIFNILITINWLMTLFAIFAWFLYLLCCTDEVWFPDWFS